MAIACSGTIQTTKRWLLFNSLITISAISDQIEGDPKNFAKYRERICAFMEQNRESFEPFVEDDEPWDKVQCNEMFHKLSDRLVVSVTNEEERDMGWELGDPSRLRRLHGQHYDPSGRIRIISYAFLLICELTYGILYLFVSLFDYNSPLINFLARSTSLASNQLWPRYALHPPFLS